MLYTILLEKKNNKWNRKANKIAQSAKHNTKQQQQKIY
jgi:hypothetical protein